MSVEVGHDFPIPSSEFIFHFDVDDHHLKLSTFVSTAEKVRSVIEALDEVFFFNVVEYDILLLPPSEGGFLSRLAIVVSGGVTAIFAFLNSDVGAAYVKGLTEKSPAEWAEDFGESHRQELLKHSQYTEDDISEEERAVNGQRHFLHTRDDIESCKNSAQILSALAQGVFEKSNEELKDLGLGSTNFSKLTSARADFYAVCMNDRDIRGIGFSEGHDFPIPRNQFFERSSFAWRDEDDIEPDWYVGIENIFVTSPNWDVDDQKSRQWKGKDQALRDCYFVIDDMEFWDLVENKLLRVDVLDALKVQWAFQIHEGRVRSRRVLRVLEFNGEQLAEPLPDEAVRAIVGEFMSTKKDGGQASLFDNW